MMNKNFLFYNKNLASKSTFIVFSLCLVGTFLFSFNIGEDSGSEKSKVVRKVMIDAGHGGHDPGNLCTQRYKKTEKDLALEISLKVGEKIKEQHPDVEVLYTRTTDVFLELHERTALANKNEVDLFISIHCDAVDNSAAHGCSSYVIGPAKNSANLKLAQRENATMLKEKDYEKNYSGFDPYSPESYIEMSLRQNAHISKSLNFAQMVQDEMRTTAKRKDRGVKQAPYWVISFTTMPSVLVELGFSTNEAEEDFLRSSDGQKKMSNSIVKAFKKYKEAEEIEVVEEVVASNNDIQVESVKNDVDFDDVPDTEVSLSEEVEVADMPGEIFFKVQIATSSKKVVMNRDNFKGLDSVEEYKSGGLYKYTVGKEKSYKKAKSLMKNIKEDIYPGAFIVAFKGSKRIDLADAMIQ